MSLATLDTHEVVKDLRSAGFTDAQAEAVARNIRKAQDLDLSIQATTGDNDKSGTDLGSGVAKVRTDLRNEIAKMRTDLMLEIEKLRVAVSESKAEIIKWVVGAIGFQTLIILGGVVGLVRSLRP